MPGGRNIIYYQMSDPRDSSCINSSGVCPGVLAAGISDSHIKLVARGKRNNVPSAMVQYKLYRMEWKHVFHIVGRVKDRFFKSNKIITSL